MADIFDWSTTPGNNGTVNGINIAENCPPANINNAIRSVMALVKNTFGLNLQNFFTGTAALPIANGGTGAQSAAAARSSLGLGTLATQSAAGVAITGGTITGLGTPLPIASGGTGAITASAALTALGGLGVSAYSLASPGYIKFTNGLTIQWGSVSIGPDSGATVTYPVAFTTVATPNVSAVALFGSTGNSQNTGYVSHTLTTLTIWNTDDRFVSVPWIAIGV